MTSYRLARRIVVGVVGGTVLLAGLAMTALPGPAVVVIPLGLGILALEFAWARHWLRKLRQAAGLGATRSPALSSSSSAADCPGGQSPASSPHGEVGLSSEKRL